MLCDGLLLFFGVCVFAFTHHGRCFALPPGRLVGILDCLFLSDRAFDSDSANES